MRWRPFVEWMGSRRELSRQDTTAAPVRSWVSATDTSASASWARRSRLAQDDRSPFSPWPGRTCILALCCRSWASDRPTSFDSLNRPDRSRRTYRLFVPVLINSRFAAARFRIVSSPANGPFSAPEPSTWYSRGHRVRPSGRSRAGRRRSGESAVETDECVEESVSDQTDHKSAQDGATDRPAQT